MTKADLVDTVHELAGLPGGEAREAIEIIFDTIGQILAEGESVKIPSFCTINVRRKHARRGRNPQTGEELVITPRRVVSFKPGQKLKEAVEQLDKTQNSLRSVTTSQRESLGQSWPQEVKILLHEPLV